MKMIKKIECCACLMLAALLAAAPAFSPPPRLPSSLPSNTPGGEQQLIRGVRDFGAERAGQLPPSRDYSKSLKRSNPNDLDTFRTNNTNRKDHNAENSPNK